LKGSIVFLLVLILIITSIPIPLSYAQSNIDSDNDIFPTWIKKVFKYWADGDTTDTDLRNALEFLIKEEILIVSTNDQPPNPNPISETRNQFSNIVKQIQNDPLLDAVASVGLGQIPIAGPILSAIYENSKDSPEDKNEQILNIINNLTTLNDSSLKKELEKLEQNKNAILTNTNYLKELELHSISIIQTVEENNKMLKILIDQVKDNEKLLKLQIENQKKIMTRLNIPEKDIEIGNIPVSSQVLLDLKENERIIEEQAEENKKLKSRIIDIEKELAIKTEETELLILQTKEFTVEEDIIVDFDYLLQLANTHFYAGEYEKAIEINDKILDVDPKHVNALSNKGWAFSYLFQFEDAIANYNQALEIDPNYLNALVGKANVLYNLHDNQKAILYFDQALEIDPNNIYALDAQGHTFINQGKYENAIANFNRILELIPNDLNALTNKGFALYQLENYEEALKLFEEVLEIDPNYVRALDWKKETLYKLGQ
jgi:tetratricopeptide (TPR) repeat protein